MTGLLLTLLLLAQDFPRSLLLPASAVPVSAELTRAKAGFESLARMAGINVVFDPDFLDRPITPPIRIENAAIIDALEALSVQTGNFVEVLDSQTIVVAPDEAAKHSQYDAKVIKAFYVSTGPNLLALASLIRLRLPTPYVSQSTAASAIIIRETPARVAQAENIVRGVGPLASRPPATAASNALGHLLVLDSTGSHTATPRRAEVQFLAGRPLSFRMTGTSQAIFEDVARTAGLNIVFDSDFRSVSGTSFNVENVDALQALDLLSVQTRTFWEVLNEKTILVAPDNETKRRKLESLIVKTFTLGGAATSVRIIEIVTVLRALLNMRLIAVSPTANTIVICATATDMTLAEKIIDDLKDPGGTLSTSSEIPAGSETGLILRRRAVRPLNAVDLDRQTTSQVSITFETKPSVRTSYEELAKLIGVQIAFDKGFSDSPVAPLKLQGIGAFDALDFLSLHTGNIWKMAEAGTIIVSADGETALQEFEVSTPRTINVRNLTQQRITEAVTVLKTLFNFRQVEGLASAVQINDTQANIALAEKIVAEMDR